MYVVIFTAKVKESDEQYSLLAPQMRELAFSEYQCKGFNVAEEGGLEIAVSYWDSLEDITSWKNDSRHKEVQSLGKSMWYEHYTVDIAKIERRYKM